MKTHKYKIAVLLATFGLSASFAAELSKGPQITTSDLACQLGIFSTSLTYKQEKPFTHLAVGLVYKEKNRNGEYVEKADVLYTTYSLDKAATEQSVKIFVDKNASTIIVGSSTSHGKGVEISIPNSTMTPPTKLKNGNYALINALSDSQKTDSEENIKGILELIVKASD